VSVAVTQGIRVEVRSEFRADRSAPAAGRFLFTYTVRIANEGREPAQLASRHWVITDANGKVLEVKGLGVVGQQPMLKPGESFEYTSGTHLETAVGTMHGTYQMIAEDGRHFDAPIPSFTLSVPRVLH
jgi:ApaG protein